MIFVLLISDDLHAIIQYYWLVAIGWKVGWLNGSRNAFLFAWAIAAAWEETRISTLSRVQCMWPFLKGGGGGGGDSIPYAPFNNLSYRFLF